MLYLNNQAIILETSTILFPMWFDSIYDKKILAFLLNQRTAQLSVQYLQLFLDLKRAIRLFALA